MTRQRFQVTRQRFQVTHQVTQELYKSEDSSIIFANCALHIAANCGIHCIEGKRLVVQLARSPTDEHYKSNVIKLKESAAKSLSESNIQRLLAAGKQFIFCKIPKMRTNYGEVTINSSEQQNFKYLKFRDSSLITGLKMFIDDQNKHITERRDQALKLLQQGKEVIEHAVQETHCAYTNLAKAGWMIETPNIISLDTANMPVSVVFTIKRNLLSRIISFDLSASSWEGRISCPCGRFQMMGYPCPHASFVLVHVRVSNDKQFAKFAHSPWQYWKTYWYSPVFHLQKYLQQYSPANCLTLEISSSTNNYLLLPPAIKARKGRKRKSRFKRRVHRINEDRH